jgi:hypothetical protein
VETRVRAANVVITYSLTNDHSHRLVRDRGVLYFWNYPPGVFGELNVGDSVSGGIFGLFSTRQISPPSPHFRDFGAMVLWRLGIS